MEKKEAAWVLYEQGYTQTNIAKMLEVSERTIYDWKEKEGWEKRLANKKMLWETNADLVGELIHYQLRTLRKMAKRWEESGANKLLEKGQIDALSKLYATIKRKEMTWANYITVSKELMEYLGRENLKLAQQLTEHIDLFLNEIREQL